MEAGLGGSGGSGPGLAAAASAAAGNANSQETSRREVEVKEEKGKEEGMEEKDLDPLVSDGESDEEAVPECRICRGEAEEGESLLVLTLYI